MKVATIADILAAQGRGTQSLFNEVDRLLGLSGASPASEKTLKTLFWSHNLHKRKGQNIKTTFQHVALLYNDTTHYNLNNQHKLEL